MSVTFLQRGPRRAAKYRPGINASSPHLMIIKPQFSIFARRQPHPVQRTSVSSIGHSQYVRTNTNTRRRTLRGGAAVVEDGCRWEVRDALLLTRGGLRGSEDRTIGRLRSHWEVMLVTPGPWSS